MTATAQARTQATTRATAGSHAPHAGIGLRRGLSAGLREHGIFALLLAAPLALLCLFFVYPLSVVVLRSLSHADGSLGLANYARIFSLGHLPRVMANSLWLGIATTVVCLILGFAIAYALHRSRIPGKAAIRLALLLPLLAPSLVQALGLIFLLGRNGLLNKVFDWDLHIYGFSGLLLANCLYALPQAVMIIEAALARSDARPYEAALLLGASRWRRFCDITLPSAKFGLISAAFVVFTVSITDFGSAAVIGGDYQVLAMEIYTQVVGQMDFNMGAVVGILLLAPTLLAVYIQRVAKQRQSGVASESALAVRPECVWHRDVPLAAVVYSAALVIAAIVATVVFASFVQLWPYRLDFTLANYRIEMAGGYSSLWFTLWISLQTAAIGTLLLFMLALAQRRLKPLAARAVYLLAIVPVGVPGMVLGLSYALSYNLADSTLGLLYGSSLLIALCNVYHYHSQGFLTMVAGVRSVPVALEETVASLGGGIGHWLRDVILPVTAPSLVAVFFFLLMRAMVTLSAVIFLITPALSVAAVTVMRLDQAGKSTQAAAFSVCIMACVLVTMGLMRWASAWAARAHST